MTKLYLEDNVYRKDDFQAHAVVLKCWYEGNDGIPISDDPLMRNLKPGEVGVAYYPLGKREICPEDDFELLDRTFRPGSVCKRLQEDTMSGIVLKTHVNVRVQHAITHQLLDRWVPLNETNPGHELEIGDHVINNDWVGQIIELFDEVIVQTSNGDIRRFPDLGARLSIGYKGEDVLVQAAGGNVEILKKISEFSPPSPDDVCLGLRHRLAAISWLAINQTLLPEESTTRQRPKRLWRAEEFDDLTLVRRRTTVRIGEIITLNNHGNAPVSRHPNKITRDVIEVRHFVVRDRQTHVTVLWQDGTKETKLARDLVPHLHPDEYECWPGDHVLWKADGKSRTAVVQVVQPSQRVAILKLTDGAPSSPENEMASLLELDPHGTHDTAANDPTPPPDEFGVHRGEFVFIHREGTTNGSVMPRVPKIGELESWVQDVPSLHTMQPGGFTDVIYAEGLKIVTTEENWRDSSATFAPTTIPVKPVYWFGYVSDLCTNGQIEVTLPHGEKVLVPLQRLTRLYDGLDQLEDMFEEGFSEEGSSMEDAFTAGGNWLDGSDTGLLPLPPELMWLDQLGGGENTGKAVADAEADEDEEVTDATMSDTMDTHMDFQEIDPPQFPGGLPAEDVSITPQVSTTPVPRGPQTPQPVSQPHEPPRDSGNDDLYWKQFDILPSVPEDHAFYDRPVAQPSRTFMARLHKEYRALSTGLPASILVRAYEDRGDLLRSLIIGPENTPYEDAPFVIDWMLDADFPQTPPIAFFISWTNGNGRVNPNLYEDGKVCLSILGTWSGEKSETWQPSRSSLLQALVSIQGLVLVKEPYFCEPAYEKFRGTNEGGLNSRLYNEKAYVLSRGFILRALEKPPGSLEDEIRGFYLSPLPPKDEAGDNVDHDWEGPEGSSRGRDGGQRRLQKVLKESKDLISLSQTLQQQSQTPPLTSNQDQLPVGPAEPPPIPGEDPAVPSLTAGGILTLQRVLSKLSNIQINH